MNYNFKNKTIIVTGGTRGIGRSLAMSFQDKGGTVIITGTKQYDKVFVEGLGEKTEYIQLDLSSKRSLNSFRNRIKDLKRIDVLINNAGINKIDSISKISTNDWDNIYEVNLRSPFLLIKEISKKMMNQKKGKILNVASIFSVVSKKKRSAYSSTKWGLIGLTKAVALDLAPFNVQVNAVSPGFIDTELTKKILTKREIQDLTEKIPQGRLGKPREIAEIVLFLCSEKNTYITGQNIIIDGGFTLE